MGKPQPHPQSPYQPAPPVREPDTVEVTLWPEDMKELSVYLGRNVKTHADLVAAVRNLSTVNLQGVEITLEPAILHRLESRAIGVPLKDYLLEEVPRWAAERAGL